MKILFFAFTMSFLLAFSAEEKTLHKSYNCNLTSINGENYGHGWALVRSISYHNKNMKWVSNIVLCENFSLSAGGTGWVKLKSGTSVSFHSNGMLKSGTLAQDEFITKKGGGLIKKLAGSRIYLDSQGYSD